MSAELFANNATTTLNGAINDAVTSLVVTSAALFPASGNFRILIDSEILLVTTVAGTTFTVTRGAESTTPASHSNGATITHILTAASVIKRAPTFVRKTADETVNNSTTLQNDNHLVFAMGDSDIWVVRYTLFIDGATAADFKCDLDVPAGCTGFFGGVGLEGGATGVTGSYSVGATSTLSSVRILGASGAGAANISFVDAILINSTTAGNVTLRWAQNSADASDTIVKSGSFLMAWHVG